MECVHRSNFGMFAPPARFADTNGYLHYSEARVLACVRVIKAGGDPAYDERNFTEKEQELAHTYIRCNSFQSK